MMTIKLALAGAGLIGKRHVAAIAECDGVLLSAIADPSPAARDYARAIGVSWYESLAALFAQEAHPHGVVLATPNNLHVDNGLTCVNAGCPMLVEKPLATSAAEGEKLVTAARAAGVPLLVGHHRRHNPLVQKAREVIDGGRLGRLRTVHASCWLYKPNEYFDKAPWRRQKGAGPVSVNLVHDVDLIRYFCGDIVSVQAQATRSLRGHDNEDVAAAVLRFADGVIGTLTVSDAVVSPWSWEHTAGENPVYPHTAESCYLLGGSHGSLSVPDLTLWENKGERSWWRSLHKTTFEHAATEPLVRQIRQFAAVIAGTSPPLVSGEEGVKTLRVIEAIDQSAVNGGIVYL